MRDERRDQEEVDGGRKSADLHQTMVQKGNGPGQKLEGEQKGGRKTEEEGSCRRKTGATTNPATTFGVAEEATTASAGDNRACSNGGD